MGERFGFLSGLNSNSAWKNRSSANCTLPCQYHIWPSYLYIVHIQSPLAAGIFTFFAPCYGHLELLWDAEQWILQKRCGKVRIFRLWRGASWSPGVCSIPHALILLILAKQDIWEVLPFHSLGLKLSPTTLGWMFLALPRPCTALCVLPWLLAYVWAAAVALMAVSTALPLDRGSYFHMGWGMSLFNTL